MSVPPFWEHRNAIFEKLWQKQQEENKAKSQPITITFPDGKTKEVQSWVTTPQDIAASISKKLGESTIVSKVNGQLWDVGRPLEESCSFELVTDFNDKEAQKVFWHSSAHVLGYAMEKVYKARLNVGPATEKGFFYEGDTGEKTASESDYPALEEAMKELIKTNAPYQRLVVKKADALEMFAYTPLKSDILKSKVPEDGTCTVYRCGMLVDPCKGPHLLNTSRVKAVAVLKNSSAYLHGESDKQILQRIYAISYPTVKQLEEFQERLKQQQQRDHRNIGKQQQLWMFNEVAPGCCFFHPHGARIYNTLCEVMRKQYRRRGFEEVITPNLFHCNLWRTSGHWDHYKDDMFKVIIEDDEHALKPMNCPGHAMMFKNQARSYRELPIRFADFGVLHRNENSGALSGLTRVRRFQQDDAHIFCTRFQVQKEIEGALEFMSFIYDIFGFNFYLNLSTRNPKKFIGDIKVWEMAEEQLRKAMCAFCGIKEEDIADPYVQGGTFRYNGGDVEIKKLKKLVEDGKEPAPKQYWLINPEDAAFYGPKIDIQVEDCMERKHQCATIQLDFNMPERFQLSYVMSSEEKQQRRDLGEVVGLENNPEAARPVVIHRAVLGSLERIIAVLTEHWGGKWPFWLSPRQVNVVPVAADYNDYAREVKEILCSEGFYADIDLSDNNLKKKILNSEAANGYNITVVVGAKERDNKSVNFRIRGRGVGQATEERDLPSFISWLKQLKDTYDKDH